jgi:hypothetical protein
VTREEIRAWVDRTRDACKLPRHVEDEQVLRDLAQAILEPRATCSPATTTTTTREADVLPMITEKGA